MTANSSENIINLKTFESRIFCQNGEDGITIKLIELLYDNPNNKYYVEFGVGNGEQCNTRMLRERFGWSGLQMDSHYGDDRIGLKKEVITKENIVSLFNKYNVPHKINVLSVDIDFNDFYCLKEILNNFQCDIIICEYNGTHLPNEDKVIIYDKNGRWDGTNYYGSSLLALDKLGRMYNYSLVYCEKMGVNCFFVRNEMISDNHLQFININDITKIYSKPKHCSGPNGGHIQDPRNRPFISFEKAITL